MEKKQCPHCPKSFKNVQEHITKMHNQYRFVCDDNDEISMFRNNDLINKSYHTGNGWDDDGEYIIYESNNHTIWINVDTFKIKMYRNEGDGRGGVVFMTSPIVEMTEKFKKMLTME
jgi:hypothetical protein